MNIKRNFQKFNDFRSSLRYRPWGILVGVIVSYPTRAVAQLLGESRAYGQDDLNCGVFAISDNTKLILGRCSMNKWWRWHRSHILACFGRNFVCHVTYLPISPQGRPRFERSYRITYSSQWNSKLYVQKNNYVPNSPVELAHSLLTHTCICGTRGRWINVCLSIAP